MRRTWNSWFTAPGEGDLNAFVELTRRFQHFAFGSALALLGDFHQAQDTVQEAFLAAWSGLPSSPTQPHFRVGCATHPASHITGAPKEAIGDRFA
jgi:hypothetical protein